MFSDIATQLFKEYQSLNKTQSSEVTTQKTLSDIEFATRMRNRYN